MGGKNIVKEPRLNQQIRAREVRVIDEGGQQLGILPVVQALQVARERGFDLVEVAPDIAPPVCRLLDYGKYKYDQSKKERKSRKGQRATLLRELRMRPKIGKHDLEAKVRIIEKLLEEGNRVRVSMVFRGRERVHPEVGALVLQKLMELLKDVAVLENPPLKNAGFLAVEFSRAPAKQAKEASMVKEEASNTS